MALARSRQGHGQVVAVVGEPGVGKSRLFHEFAHSHRLHGWLVLESESVSYGRATASLPVVELLTAYFEIESEHDSRKIREKVTGKLLSLDRQLESSLPALLALFDVPVEDAAWSAVFADGFDANAVLVNNVLVGEAGQAALYCGNFNDPNPPVVQYNDVFTPTGAAYGGICADQTGINGNLSVNPAFLSPENTDYRLQLGAPVIDRGNSAAAGVPPTDLDGRSRILDGDGDGVAVVEMGAYETQGRQTITVAQGAPAAAGYGTAFTISASGGGSGNPVVIEGSDACTGGGNNSASITMTSGTGMCTITFSQAGDPDYLPAQPVVQTTAAQRATPTITWRP